VSPTTLVSDVEATVEEGELAVEVDLHEEPEQAELTPSGLVTAVVVPPLPSASQFEPVSPQRSRLLGHLIGMANLYARNGSTHQAIELYFELVTDHDGTDQASQACERLLGIAQRYEENGELHQARSLYERLLNAS
jgi:hypothetical protein